MFVKVWLLRELYLLIGAACSIIDSVAYQCATLVLVACLLAGNGGCRCLATDENT